MRNALLLALSLSLCPSAATMAIDLAKIERPAVKLPEPRSAAVQYCLLVFGPDAAQRVMLVHDGDRLFVDRNGNGDLTEPGETVAADRRDSKPAEGVFSFKAGDIPTAAGEHKDLRVSWMNIDHMQLFDPAITARLKREPKFRGCLISLDVVMPGHQGQALDGRVNQMTTLSDCHGLLEFAPRVEDAPIVHFGGPWHVTLSGAETWNIGRSQDVALVVGTPGVGPGTTAAIAYENVIPAGLKPKLEITFPAADGETPLAETCELPVRCCGVNFHGDVAVPAEVPPGVATVRISLPGWPGTTVADTRHDVQILPAPPGPQAEPVSSRLAGKLQHQRGNAIIAAIQFSPDGKRVLAGDNSGGLVHVWELAEGKRLATLDTGKGMRSGEHFVVVTPDWKTIVAPTVSRGKVDRVQRDGKMFHRASFDGSLRVWDLESGELRHTWKDDPPRSTNQIYPLPQGNQFCAIEQTPGEYESARPRAVSLWDAATGEHKQLFASPQSLIGFSPDRKQAVVSIPRTDAAGPHDCLAIYDTASWQAACEFPLRPAQHCDSAYFLQDPPMVAGTVTTDANSDTELKLWTLPGGEESWSLAGKEGEDIVDVQQTPDHRALILTTISREKMSGRVLRVDLTTHDMQVVFDEPHMASQPPVFHPGGKWMVLPVQELMKSILILVRSDPPVAEWPQPHLQVRDVASGALLEEVVSPPALAFSVVFSPDGNTLASSGAGGVLLWDFSDPPGKAAPAAVGQPFAAAGTLAGGARLDWAAYRGKVVLVTYWATWCQPCVAEIPEIRRAYDALHGRGFDVLAVSLDVDQAGLERFLATQDVPWQVVGGATAGQSGPQHPLARKYGVESVPQFFLLDRQGNIAATGTHAADLLKLAEKLLGPEDEKAK
jgi:WD40 repeat protein